MGKKLAKVMKINVIVLLSIVLILLINSFLYQNYFIYENEWGGDNYIIKLKDWYRIPQHQWDYPPERDFVFDSRVLTDDWSVEFFDDESNRTLILSNIGCDSNSMYPSLGGCGTKVIEGKEYLTEEELKQIKLGDVISYGRGINSSEFRVIHRVVSINDINVTENGTVIVTKGDNNDLPDYYITVKDKIKFVSVSIFRDSNFGGPG